MNKADMFGPSQCVNYNSESLPLDASKDLVASLSVLMSWVMALKLYRGSRSCGF